MKRVAISLLGALPAFVGVGFAQAQESADEELLLAYGDKETISIATGSKVPLRRAPSVASVITAEDIAAMGATDLDEVLETVPGIHVSRTNTYFSTYVVRGMFGGQINPQVLMLQNGIPLTTLYRGNKGGNWAGMSLENVARIEIIRGHGSLSTARMLSSAWSISSPGQPPIRQARNWVRVPVPSTAGIPGLGMAARLEQWMWLPTCVSAAPTAARKSSRRTPRQRAMRDSEPMLPWHLEA